MTEMHNSPIISCNSRAIQAMQKRLTIILTFSIVFIANFFLKKWKDFKTLSLQILQLLQLLQPPKEVGGKDGGNRDNIRAPEPDTRADIR